MLCTPVQSSTQGKGKSISTHRQFLCAPFKPVPVSTARWWITDLAFYHVMLALPACVLHITGLTPCCILHLAALVPYSAAETYHVVVLVISLLADEYGLDWVGGGSAPHSILPPSLPSILPLSSLFLPLYSLLTHSPDTVGILEPQGLVSVSFW